MPAASTSLAPPLSARQLQRRAPLPGTTSSPVPKQNGQTTGSAAAEEAGGREELPSSASGTTANPLALMPVDIAVTPSLSSLPRRRRRATCSLPLVPSGRLRPVEIL